MSEEFENAYHTAFHNNLDFQSSPRKFAECLWQAALAHAASIPLTVALPKRNPDGDIEYKDDIAYGYNSALDDIRALNADKSIVWEKKK